MAQRMLCALVALEAAQPACEAQADHGRSGRQGQAGAGRAGPGAGRQGPLQHSVPLLQVCTSLHITKDALLLQELCLPAACMASARRRERTWVSGLGRARQAGPNAGRQGALHSTVPSCSYPCLACPQTESLRLLPVVVHMDPSPGNLSIACTCYNLCAFPTSCPSPNVPSHMGRICLIELLHLYTRMTTIAA